MLLLSLAITVCVVAWGFLVFAAIDFGSSARGGESQAWAYLALACVGAAACLFIGMILVGRLLRAAGIITDPTPPPRDASPPGETRPAGSPSLRSESAVEDTAERPAVGKDAESRLGDTNPALPVVRPRGQGGKRAAR